MDAATLTIIIISVIIAVISLIFGIFFLIKYAKTRKNIYLIVGILLTFVIPGIIIYIIFMFYTGSSPMIEYGPNPGMLYGPGPA